MTTHIRKVTRFVAVLLAVTAIYAASDPVAGATPQMCRQASDCIDTCSYDCYSNFGTTPSLTCCFLQFPEDHDGTCYCICNPATGPEPNGSYGDCIR
jgi:hypothetical protein